MQLYPNRFLHEIDQVDINRLLRALEAKRMETVERRRVLFMQGRLEADKIDEDEWALIAEMDKIAAANG